MTDEQFQKMFINEAKPALDWNSTADEYVDGYDRGKRAYYDEIWDSIQFNGTRTNYYNTFTSWPDELFYPKYDIAPERLDCFLWNSTLSDFVGRLKECNIKFDTSNLVSAYKVFGYAKHIINCPKIVIKDNISIAAFFYVCQSLVTIEKLVLGNGVTFDSQTFYWCYALKNIVIEGTINNTCNMSYSTELTVDSAKSIINALANYKGTENEGVYSLKFTSSVWDRLEASGSAPDGVTWKNYVQSLGWLI